MPVYSCPTALTPTREIHSLLNSSSAGPLADEILLGLLLRLSVAMLLSSLPAGSMSAEKQRQGLRNQRSCCDKRHNAHKAVLLTIRGKGTPRCSCPSLRDATPPAWEESSAVSGPDKTPVAIRVCMSASSWIGAASLSAPPAPLFRLLVLRSSSVVLTPLKLKRANLILVRSSLLGDACEAISKLSRIFFFNRKHGKRSYRNLLQVCSARTPRASSFGVVFERLYALPWLLGVAVPIYLVP